MPRTLSRAPELASRNWRRRGWTLGALLGHQAAPAPRGWLNFPRHSALDEKKRTQGEDVLIRLTGEPSLWWIIQTELDCEVDRCRYLLWTRRDNRLFKNVDRKNATFVYHGPYLVDAGYHLLRTSPFTTYLPLCIAHVAIRIHIINYKQIFCDLLSGASSISLLIPVRQPNSD